MVRLVVVLAHGLLVNTLHAQIITEIDQPPQELRELNKLWLPYVFYSDSLGMGYGVGGVASGWQQPQFTTGATIMKTNRGTSALGLIAQDFRPTANPRLLVDGTLLVARYNDQRGYFPATLLTSGYGSNNSREDDFVEGEGNDDLFELEAKYILPIGHGRDNPLYHYQLQGGLLVNGATGGGRWNPLESGRSTVALQSFARHRSYDLGNDSGTTGKEQEPSFNSNGIGVSIEYDNRDFNHNPTAGSLQKIEVKRDFGWANSDDSWTTVELDLRKYLQIQSSEKLFQQEVLALRSWWIDAPTSETISTPEGKTIEHRPPHYMGAVLGGLEKMKAYPAGRFNDKSAVYYSAEYRVMPHWNPFKVLPLPYGLDVQWWQLTGFAEIGRVAEHWDLQELHQDMQWSAGIGIRLSIANVVVRVDTAFSDETSQLWFMVGQNF